MKKIFIIILILFLIGCGYSNPYYSKIEQKVTKHYKKCGYSVSTRIIIYEREFLSKRFQGTQTGEYACNVPKEKIKEVKRNQLKIILKQKKELDKLLNDDYCDKEK